MTTSHTPGPWSLNGGNAAQGWTVKTEGNELLVGGRGLTSLANARLISAAPELLEALQVAVEAMEQDWYQIDGEWGPTMEEFGDLEGAILAGKAPEIAKARAAIAKATGEAQ